MKQIFQTESQNTVHSILNIDIGVNLASIDSKLYLIHCGSLQNSLITTTTTTMEPTTTTTTTLSTVNVTFPAGGETFVIGDTITITWTSSKSASDVVKIELYEGETLAWTINGGTSNDGSYEWLIPNAFLPSDNFKIVITWLSSGNEEGNVGSSDIFAISATAVPTTTTTTTTFADPTLPDTSVCRGVTLLELRDDEYITSMIKDVGDGGVLFATSRGRILA